MKILWVNPNFLHPTTKGGQIRTLEMLKHLHERNEIHYAAFADPSSPEGVARAGEYSTRFYPFTHHVPSKSSFAFYQQLLGGLVSKLPVAISRFYSREMGDGLEQLMQKERFDSAVCDFLAPAAHFPRIERSVLFQHNVETMIWRRRAEHQPNGAKKLYYQMQAEKMLAFEHDISRKAGHIVAVSAKDAETMRELFQVKNVSAIPTGVNVEYFAPQPADGSGADIMFVGSMDWLPNVDGVQFFVERILPLIRKRRPDCTVAIVGRTPPEEILQMAAKDPQIRVTGTVPDVRPYLWGSKISIVPLRIGGGTRLKIYEAMAAGVPVVSTAVGAEGLDVVRGETIHLADSPEDFAECCLQLLENREARERMARDALNLVVSRFSWNQVSKVFEEILLKGPRLF